MNKDSKAQLHLDYEGGQAATLHSLANRRRRLAPRALQHSSNLLFISHSF